MTQNRVSATGEIVDSPLRGAWMGNRGVLHRGAGAGARVVRPWANRRWIVCATEFRGWRAPMWVEGRWTALFFHDEAVALAAGHRPCALCRHAAYKAFGAAWAGAFGGDPPGADDLDRRLHADRLDGRTQRTHRRPWRDLPDGVFVRWEDGPAVVRAGEVVPWSPLAGYCGARARPRRGDATVMTPAGTVDVIGAGYIPQMAITTR